MSSETTITILPTHLRLVHIPLARQEALMSRILDCWWFRRENDPFFALCHNNVELSLFADAAAVRRCFGEFMRRPESEGKGKERASDDQDVNVGEELWVALEIAFGGNGWEEAAPRLHALTSPLAASNISILFVSTFFSDYVLVRASSLGLVTSILEHEGFSFAEADPAMEEELKGMRMREGEERAAGSGRSTRRSSRVDGTGCRYGYVEDEDGLSDLVGSLVLSDAGSVGTAGAGGRGASSTERPGTSRSPSFSLSRSNSLHLSTSTLGGAAPALSPNPLAPASAASGSSAPPPPLSLLPDELVCIGLSPAHEAQWRIKVVEALFYPERVLPRASRAASALSSSPLASPATLPLAHRAPVHHAQRGPRTRPSGRGAGAVGGGMGPRPQERRPAASTALPTPLAPYPVPFVALTQTPDGTSLTADVRLLRALFPPPRSGGGGGAGGDGVSDEMVFATGEAGLAGVWEGEEGLMGWEDEWHALRAEEDEDEDGWRGAASSEGGESSATDSEDYDVDEWQAGSPSAGSSGLPSTDDEDGDEAGNDSAGCTASDRTLLKCLQLDLMSFGLDKPGLVEHYAQVLIDGGVRSLLYQSTYGSANILVAKRDVGRARRLLLRG
ncbi:hypothetical protein JCM3770_002442 [Rhodotorula araucariae]